MPRPRDKHRSAQSNKEGNKRAMQGLRKSSDAITRNRTERLAKNGQEKKPRPRRSQRKCESKEKNIGGGEPRSSWHAQPRQRNSENMQKQKREKPADSPIESKCAQRIRQARSTQRIVEARVQRGIRSRASTIHIGTRRWDQENAKIVAIGIGITYSVARAATRSLVDGA